MRCYLYNLVQERHTIFHIPFLHLFLDKLAVVVVSPTSVVRRMGKKDRVGFFWGGFVIFCNNNKREEEKYPSIFFPDKEREH